MRLSYKLYMLRGNYALNKDKLYGHYELKCNKLECDPDATSVNRILHYAKSLSENLLPSLTRLMVSSVEHPR